MTYSKQKALNALLRTRFSAFLQKSFYNVNPSADYSHNWHIDLITEYLEALERGEIKRLIINMPPRSLKSIAVSVAWPAWILGRNPRARILAASYAKSLALKHSSDTRLLMKSDWYKEIFPKTILSLKEDEKSKFITTSRGFRLATSVGASVIGEGGDFLIVDDPHNPRQALSDVMRERAIEWFSSSFLTRLNNREKGSVVIVMQRLHDRDLTGAVCEASPNLWHKLVIPAIAESRETISFGKFNYIREEGEVLNKERDSLAIFENLKSELGSYVFAGQFQQRPVPKDGGIIKQEWINARYDFNADNYIEKGEGVIISWDTGIKAGIGSDPSCATVWGYDNSSYYILDVFRKRMEYPELKRSVGLLAEKWCNVEAILIEDKASGQSLIQDLKRESSLPIIAINPRGDKAMRLAAVSPLFESGKVKLPKKAKWLVDFEHELLTFPSSAHDDQVDSVSQFLNWKSFRQSNVPMARRL